MPLRIARIPPVEVDAALDDVARLRIDVFRDFPYLYDGDMDYERRYISTYRESADAVIIGAWDGGALVGAATGTPMEDHAREFAEPFGDAGYDLREIFYCAESVLRVEHRGQGAGHAFFDQREGHARALGRRFSCFCAVIRPPEHAPTGYRPLDGFWQKRGYAPMQGVLAEFSWKDVGDATETKKSLQFWIKELD